MDKDSKEVLDFLSETYDSEFEIKKIGDIIWEADHYYNVTVSRDYNQYTVKEFIILYQIDCLYEKGEITEKDHDCLIRLFHQRIALYSRLSDSSSSEELWRKIDVIDNVFEKYNIGNINLGEMIYNSTHVETPVDLNEIIVKEKL